MSDGLTDRDGLLPCPFCGDDGDKGRQHVTQMVDGKPRFDRITCRACGAMCPEPNWNRRATPSPQAPAVTSRLPGDAPMGDVRTTIETALRHAAMGYRRGEKFVGAGDALAAFDRHAQVPDGWKLLKDTTQAERSWPEDSAHENGAYYCRCGHCLREFIGHKRRVRCKVCAAPSPTTQAGETPEGTK